MRCGAMFNWLECSPCSTDDSIVCYGWENGAATLDRKIVIGKQKEDKTGSRYPAGVAVSSMRRASR